MNTSFEINRDKTTTTWLTPKWIIDALGPFDTDPGCPENMPWPTAKIQYTEKDDGLIQSWHGRVWCNPPYGPKAMPAFLEKMAKHGNGILLTFNRTETAQFQEWVFPYCSGILFKKGRIHFLNDKGEKVGNGSGCGSLLIAYGEENAEILRKGGIPGHFQPFNTLW